MEDKQIDPNTLKLFVAHMEALQVVLTAMRAPGGYTDANLEYLIQARLAGRAPDDLTTLGLAQLEIFLAPKSLEKGTLPGRPILQLIQGGLAKQDK